MQRISNFWNSFLFLNTFENIIFKNILVQVIKLKTSDQYEIAITLFEPDFSAHKILLVNSATGVKQQTYYDFAEYFAQNGYTVITYDYRGISLSKPEKMKGFEASMRIWGNTDYKTVTDFIQQKYPFYRKFVLGHSVGALILGMNPDSEIFEKCCFVATQNTYFGNLGTKIKLLSFLGFGLYQPIVTQLKGYFETQLINLGESLPKGVSDDWRTLIVHKKSINRLLEKTNDYSKNLSQEVLYLHMEDDEWITEKGMKLLMNATYSNMKTTYRTVKVSESTGEPIGHINFFRAKHSQLWKIVLDWFS